MGHEYKFFPEFYKKNFYSSLWLDTSHNSLIIDWKRIFSQNKTSFEKLSTVLQNHSIIGLVRDSPILRDFSTFIISKIRDELNLNIYIDEK